MIPIFKALFRFYSTSSGLWLWALRRFTKLGMGLLAGLFIALLMVPDTENNVAYQGFTMLFCLLALGFGFSFYFPFRFSAKRSLPRFGTVGQSLRYSVRLKNLTRKPQTGLVLLENLADSKPSFQDWLATQLAEERHSRSLRLSQARRTHVFKLATTREVEVPSLPPNQWIDLTAELIPFRRGPLRLKGLTIARPDPLGLFRSFRKQALPESVLILPRRYPIPSVALPGTMKYQQGGVALASHVGQSDEFVALRDYREGDPLRHIHWRSWARVGKPVVREFEDEFFVRHALVLDTFVERVHPDVFEEAVAVAASFACTIQSQESLLDLLFVGPESYCFTSGRGVAHADQMLEILASVSICREKPFHSLEHLVINHIKMVSGCICVLLAWDKERQDFVRKLQALSIPLIVLVIIEAGGKLNLEPGPMSEAPHRFHILEAGQLEQGLAKLQ